MSKRPSDEALRTEMNRTAMALLKAHYGCLQTEDDAASLPDTANTVILPKADVFNAVVNWLRTDSGMEPIKQERSGIADLAAQRDAARKR